MFSLYVGPANPSGLAAVTSSLGAKVQMASDYFDDTSWSGIDDDQWDINAWKGKGYRMIWGVPMLPTSGGYTLATGATGAYNDYFSTLAQNLIAAGSGNSILRLGWEFNSSNYPWYAAGQASSFVAYWQQIVTTMRAVPGADFSFEWNVNRGDNGSSDEAMGNYASYYPGNNFVDIIAMDVYDLGWNTYPGASAEFQSILTQQWGLNWLSSFATLEGKPIALGEVGLGWGTFAPNSGPVTTASGPTSGGDDPTFINDISNWITQNNVANAVYYDSGTGSISNGENPLTESALRDDFGTAD